MSLVEARSLTRRFGSFVAVDEVDLAVEAVVAAPAGEATFTVDGVFNALEPAPESGPVAGLAVLDGSGYVRVDAACRTSCPGLFAAGDVTDVHREQVLVAVGEGAKAFLSAVEYLEGR